MYSWAELGANVPVGAGVMDCPMHKSARTHAPSTKVVRDIVEDDGLCNREDGDRGHRDSRTSGGRVVTVYRFLSEDGLLYYTAEAWLRLCRICEQEGSRVDLSLPRG